MSKGEWTKVEMRSSDSTVEMLCFMIYSLNNTIGNPDECKRCKDIIVKRDEGIKVLKTAQRKVAPRNYGSRVHPIARKSLRSYVLQYRTPLCSTELDFTKNAQHLHSTTSTPTPLTTPLSRPFGYS